MDRRLTLAAAALAMTVLCVTLRWSTGVAAGADAFGYVSQADLWLKRDLFIDQSFAANAPWPMARWTFAPLGYRPEVDGYRIVPAYAPGLPMLMAAGKAVAGQCAVYWIVPIAAALLVVATFFIGTSVASYRAGIGAAWLVATSPTVLFMSMVPMSDVPAAAAWSIALALVLRDGSLVASTGAGIASAIAILIRPNLAPLAAILAGWLFIKRRGASAGVFSVVAGIGAIAIASINWRLYGSPFRSGYDLTDAFSVANVLPNLARYGSWLAEVETPLSIAGLAWLVWTRRWLLLLLAAAVWTVYLLYVPWDAWWYLRFLLPTWPMMAVGTATLLFRLPRGVALVGFVVLGYIGIAQAWQRGAFDEAAGESKYVEVARVVEALTDQDAVVISAQHSGTLRYYAGRLTLRWDTGDLSWLDRTVDWLMAHGHHPYLVLEQSEIDALGAKAAGSSATALVDWTPMVEFRGGGVKLFDAVNRRRDQPAVQNKPSFAVDRCVPNKSVAPLR